MIAADASSLIAYFGGEIASDTDAIAAALDAKELALPPPVLVELVGKTAAVAAAFDQTLELAALLPLTDGYWRRARASRTLILSKGLKARGIDALIAQCCIDAEVPLIARDTDFRHFARWCGLKLVG